MHRFAFAHFCRAGFAFGALLLSMLGASAAGAAPAADDELLVGFHDGVSSDQAQAIYHAHGASRIEEIRGLNIHRVRVSPAALAAVARELRRRPEVRFVERNELLGPQEPAGSHAPPDELLVGFRRSVTPGDALAASGNAGATHVEKIRSRDIHRLVVPEPLLASTEALLAAHPDVAFVERQRAFAPAMVPGDAEYVEEWHLPRIGAPAAWDFTPGAPGIVIAILDSGVDGSHPDLAARMVPGYNFYDGNTNTSDVYGHGTKVAGTAAAAGNNTIGVAGVAWQAKIMPIRVSNSSGYAYSSAIANGLTWAVDHGARVMNLSFAGLTSSLTITSAAKYVRSKGGLVVAAAGNCGCVEPYAENPELISVSATHTGDDLASFSSRGDYVDLAAPGVSILTTTKGGGYASVAGTSFAAPITAGVIALMMAVNPSLKSGELETLLKANADDRGPTGWDQSFGWGRVNAYRAVAAAAGSTGSGGSSGSGGSTTGSCPSELTVDSLGVGKTSPLVSFTGTWALSGVAGAYGSTSLYSSGTGTDTYTWQTGVLSSSASCTYKVYVRWTAWTSRSTKAAYTVSGHTAGSTTKTFNQQANGGTWQLHGSYAFPAGAKVTVQLADGGGQVSADAIRVVLDTSGAVVGSSAADIVVDTSSPGTSFSGTWCDSGVKGFYGAGSLYSCGTGTTDTYRWAPTLPAAGGTFDVYVWWTAWTNRSTTVPYVVAGHSDGSTTKTFNQQVGGGSWQYHGRYTFASGAGASVEVSDKNGLASADAVLFHPIP